MDPIEQGAAPDSPIIGPHSTTEPVITAEIAYPEQPRLGISHLMLWMLGSGLLLAVHQQALKTSYPGGLSWLPWHQTVSSAISCIVSGPALASLILFVFRKARGGPSFPCQPGHWLLLAVGLVVALRNTGQLLSWAGILRDEFAFHMGAGCLAHLAASILLGMAAYRVQEPGYWRVLFAAFAALEGIVAAAYGCLGAVGLGFSILAWTRIALYLTSPAVLVAMIIVLVLDRHRAKSRDWLHWVGVLVQIASALLSLFSYASFLVLQRLFPLP